MALSTIKGWLSGCIVGHCTPDSLCETPECPVLPTRVIDVGLGTGVVKLVETKGAKAKYICLSHCWGFEQIITTTVSTLENRKRGIAWDELSKTFQDAVMLTRTLGFDYIWIDSLCIIQDSSEDWQVESSRMASVYSNGHLTIAATRSPNGRGGLFTQTPDFKVAGRTPEGESYCLFFRELNDHQIDAGFETADLNSTEKHYPLLSRAWVYQERMLSTRVLHFGHYELFFECKSAIQCECTSIPFHGAGSETPVALIKLEYANALSNYTGAQTSDDIHYQGARLWRTMICCYTALSLTHSTDRLPAIGGLARQMSTASASTYLAGLWEESLPDDLLWSVSQSAKRQRPRPQPWNAPTWSWASVETFVNYWNVILFTDVEGSVAEPRPPCEHFASIKTCRVEVAAGAVDAFGAIKSAALTLTGLVADGTLERPIEDDDSERIIHDISFPHARVPFYSDYLLDSPGPGYTGPGTAVACLRMSLVQEGRQQCLVSLVLRKSIAYPDCYERIGCLEIKGRVGSVDPRGVIFQTAALRTVVVV